MAMPQPCSCTLLQSIAFCHIFLSSALLYYLYPILVWYNKINFHLIFPCLSFFFSFFVLFQSVCRKQTLIYVHPTYTQKYKLYDTSVCLFMIIFFFRYFWCVPDLVWECVLLLFFLKLMWRPVNKKYKIKIKLIINKSSSSLTYLFQPYKCRQSIQLNILLRLVDIYWTYIRQNFNI